MVGAASSNVALNGTRSVANELLLDRACIQIGAFAKPAKGQEGTPPVNEYYVAISPLAAGKSKAKGQTPVDNLPPFWAVPRTFDTKLVNMEYTTFRLDCPNLTARPGDKFPGLPRAQKLTVELPALRNTRKLLLNEALALPSDAGSAQ